MSTRATIEIMGDGNSLFFYRGADGYPDGVRHELTCFMSMIENSQIRSNVIQAASWLVILGYHEKQHTVPHHAVMYGWKASLFEVIPKADSVLGIEWFYRINIVDKTCDIYRVSYAGGLKDTPVFCRHHEDTIHWSPSVDDPEDVLPTARNRGRIRNIDLGDSE